MKLSVKRLDSVAGMTAPIQPERKAPGPDCSITIGLSSFEQDQRILHGCVGEKKIAGYIIFNSLEFFGIAHAYGLDPPVLSERKPIEPIPHFSSEVVIALCGVVRHR